MSKIEQLETLVAQQAAVIEQMRKALQGLVKNDGVDAFYHLDKGIGTATVSGRCWLRAREAATLQPCPEVLNKGRADAVAKFAKHVDDYEVDKLAAVYIKRIEQEEA